MKLKVDLENKRFVAEVEHDHERGLPLAHGFWFNPEIKSWVTNSLKSAFSMVHYATPETIKFLSRLTIQKIPLENFEVKYPPHLKPYPFQLDAVKFSAAQNRSLLHIDAGCGKSAIAAMLSASLNVHPLVIAPPFLKATLEKEFKTWAPNISPAFLSDMQLNKDIAQRLLKTRSMGDSLLIVDECHRMKSLNAARTRALFKIFVKRFKRVVFMSGTPMPNRPIELFPILSHCAPEIIDFSDEHEFALKYCNAYQGAFGWDYTGASNTDILFQKMRDSFSFRVRKEDVLKDLPERIESILILDKKEPPKMAAFSQKIIHDLKEGSESIEALIKNPKSSTYRKELGIFKAPIVAEIARELCEGGEPLLVFAHHKDVVSKLCEKLSDFTPLKIDGSVPVSERQKIVEEFQKEKSPHKILILNIQAGGVGFTLTKAARVLFAESSWVPAENSQAIDRAHRIGQTRGVIAYHCVLPNTLDAFILSSILTKTKTLNQM